MIRYIFKRLLTMIPIMLGTAFIIFTIINLTPGDPAILILGPSAPLEAIEQLRGEMGLNDPFFVRFFHYIYNIMTKLDFGKSYLSKKPVYDEIFKRLPISINIATCGMVCACLLGIPIGVISAVRQYSAVDNISRITAMVLVAIPGFWLAMMLLLIFSLKLGWVPSSGISSWRNYILPCITLGCVNGGSVLRITRSSMLETIRSDYVRMAQAKGVPQSIVVLRHAFMNALLPVITTSGGIFGGLLGGAIVTETIFSMPGLGTLIVQCIKLKDIPTVLASIILLAFCFGIIMLIVDLLYAFCDPRIKAKYSR
ncbi:MAG: ABC transporter permease [Synergistaceae bacterium]|jgi:peptide/nickel transport system permease protein|nr:ABC transporter permease [Synergistaceae bacterium]